MMKYCNVILLSLLVPAVLLSSDFYTDQHRRDRQMLKEQQEDNLKRREEVLRRVRSFIGDINRRLGKETRTKIINPVQPEHIDDAHETDHFHTSRKVPERQFAYIDGDGVNLRTDRSLRSKIIGKLRSGERVEILGRSEESEPIAGFRDYWYVVRRQSSEGWVFGRYLRRDRLPRHKSEEREREPSRTALLVPVIGTMTSGFGWRIDPITRKRRSFHKGIDIAAPTGTPVRACSAGVVRIAQYMRNGYGKLIVVEHEKELSSYYGHLSEILVRKGDRISRGQLIGKVGATGRATGPHLHFEIRRGGTALDPDAFLR